MNTDITVIGQSQPPPGDTSRHGPGSVSRQQRRKARDGAFWVALEKLSADDQQRALEIRRANQLGWPSAVDPVAVEYSARGPVAIREAYAQAKREVAGSHYLRDRWLPYKRSQRQDPEASLAGAGRGALNFVSLITCLRQHCYRYWSKQGSGQRWLGDEWFEDQETLGGEIGRSRYTVMALLNDEDMRRFVVKIPRRRYETRVSGGASRVAPYLYLVALEDPLLPEDVAPIMARMRTLLDAQDTPVGDHSALAPSTSARSSSVRPRSTLMMPITPSGELATYNAVEVLHSQRCGSPPPQSRDANKNTLTGKRRFDGATQVRREDLRSAPDETNSSQHIVDTDGDLVDVQNVASQLMYEFERQHAKRSHRNDEEQRLSASAAARTLVVELHQFGEPPQTLIDFLYWVRERIHHSAKRAAGAPSEGKRTPSGYWLQTARNMLIEAEANNWRCAEQSGREQEIAASRAAVTREQEERRARAQDVHDQRRRAWDRDLQVYQRRRQQDARQVAAPPDAGDWSSEPITPALRGCTLNDADVESDVEFYDEVYLRDALTPASAVWSELKRHVLCQRRHLSARQLHGVQPSWLVEQRDDGLPYIALYLGVAHTTLRALEREAPTLQAIAHSIWGTGMAVEVGPVVASHALPLSG